MQPMPDSTPDSARASASPGAGAAPSSGNGDHSDHHVPTHFHHRTGPKVIVAAILFVLIAGAVIAFVIHVRLNEERNLSDAVKLAAETHVALDVVHVKHGHAENEFTLPGDARAFYETTIFSRINGYVNKWYVDIGDKVTMGQTLATIATPELDDQLNEAKAKVGQLKAEANVAKATANFAKVSYDRWKAATPEGIVSQQESDQKKSELDSSQAKLEAAQAAVRLGEASLQQLQTLESFKVVTAPFNGIITNRHIDIGALVTAGSTTNTSPLYTVDQSDRIRVFVDVPQTVSPLIRTGATADARVSELPDHTFTGIVERTSAAVDPRTRMLTVEVMVANPELRLLPGMFVQVTFHVPRAGSPLQTPAAALSIGPKGARVAVIDSSNTLNFVPVVTGRDLGDVVEIVSGLHENDVVALNVGSQAIDGDKIDPHFIDNPPAAATTENTSSPSTRPSLVHKDNE